MVLRHNLSALNTCRQLGIVNGMLAKTTRKLSSGYRINCAADDAAGLSISEKMRKQIRGLMQGIANAEDGISLCQVADGALNEVNDMLQRMNELAVKAANGTQSDSDRKCINEEIQMLKTEIDRINGTSKFNELYIFQAEGSSGTVGSGGLKPATKGRFFELLGSNVTTSGYMSEELDGSTIPAVQSTYDFSAPGNTNLPYASAHIDLTGINLKDLIGTQFYVNCCTDDCPKTVYFTDEVGISVAQEECIPTGYEYFSEIRIGLKKTDGSYYTNAQDFNQYIVDTLRDKMVNNAAGFQFYDHVQYAYQGNTLYLFDIDNYNWNPDNKECAFFCDEDGVFDTDTGGKSSTGIWIQTGAEPGDGIFLNIESVNCQKLGITNLNTLTEHSASRAINQVAYALKHVSAVRSRIGAYQNRLEHTIKNVSNIVENTVASESKIRDADMAKEMIEFTKQQILSQVAFSMLAQGNQMQQSTLKLLQ